MTSFNDLKLHPKILKNLERQEYKTPTPIQAKAIPVILEGHDLMATAQTGTGKTAGFCLPMLDRLYANKGGKGIRGLVLTPTRELALQIEENLRAYGRGLKLFHAVVLGGVNINGQIRNLKKHPDILVATPGRLLDLMGQGFVKLNRVEFLVLDEADRMLDMGFIHDVRKIIQAVNKNRQSLLFSATLSPEVTDLASSFLNKPISVNVAPPASTATKVRQEIYFVDRGNKKKLLLELIEKHNMIRALVFTKTKHRANQIAKTISKAGFKADALHSNKSQNARQRILKNFDRAKIHILVATDIVARGIDIDEITHVINFDMPHEPDSYVHRIGRTARAEQEGDAFSFCDQTEIELLRNIEKLTGQVIPIQREHDTHNEGIEKLREKGRRPRSGHHSKKRQRSKKSSRKKTESHRPEKPAKKSSKNRSPKDSHSRSENQDQSQKKKPSRKYSAGKNSKKRNTKSSGQGSRKPAKPRKRR